MKKNKVNYYLNKFKLVLFILALGFSLVGSIQLYYGRYDNILKTITVVLYSTFKLFAFAPTNLITNEAPLTYELAIWIAPAFTMVGFFSVFKKLYQSVRAFIFHMKKDHIVLLGDNEETITFIKNLNQSDEELGVILLCDISDNINEDTYKDLFVKIVKVDFSHPDADVNRMILKDEKVFNYGKMISFEEEPKNYSRLNGLAIMTDDFDKAIEIFVRTESNRIKELIEKKMDKIDQFDINYFDPNELLVKNLFENSGFSPNPPEAFKRDISEIEFTSIEEISEYIGHYNLLIIGFSEIAKKFLIQSSNYLTINPLQKLKVTIVDNDVEAKFEHFKDYREMVDKVMDVELYEMTSLRSTLDFVQEKNREEKYSLALFAFDDTKENIFHLDKCSDVLADIPFVLYSKEAGEINTVIDSLKLKHPNITAFGDLKDVLDKNTILYEKLIFKSKKFNQLYNKNAAKIMGWTYDESKEKQSWKHLSTVKKESSIYQSAHRNTKLLILRKLSLSKNFDSDVNTKLLEWNESLHNKDIEEQLRIIENDPVLNYMTSLEHQRWNNFYYMRDFKFGVKDELKKTHDCLIDDWDDFMSSIQREKAIYDTLSTISLIESSEVKDET